MADGGSDYLHEDSSRLRARIAELETGARQAIDEAAHARHLRLDLGGPAEAADTVGIRLGIEIGRLEAVARRVDAGWAYFERSGFEQAVDACGEFAVWISLSEVPAPGSILGRDDAKVRVPVEAQREYARAVESTLFQRYEMCLSMEGITAHEAIVTCAYLFGLFGNDRFLVASWEPSAVLPDETLGEDALY